MRLSPAALSLSLLSALSAGAQSRSAGARCRAACERHVTDPRTQATVCGRCVLDRDPGAWVQRLPAVPPKALLDEDWEVRWAAVRAQAKATGVTSQQRLAAWIAGANGEELTLACLSALHAAGEHKERLDAFLGQPPPAGAAPAPAAAPGAKPQGEPRGPASPPPPGAGVKPATAAAAVAACAKAADGWRPKLELGLYDMDPAVRRESLEHASAALGVPAARVVLDAMKTRAEGSDELSAALLVERALSGGPPAGLDVLRAATPLDKPQVDRLLSVWARTRDRNRPLLTSKDKDARRQAIDALAPLAPLSHDELLLAMRDTSAVFRVEAARALARGEGRTVVEAADARFAAAATHPLEERRAWLAVLAETDAGGCPAFTKALWRDASQPEVVRADALAAHGGCAGPKAYDELAAGFAESAPALKAAALKGAALVPRDARVAELAALGLKASEPTVVLAAVQAAVPHRLKAAVPALAALLESGVPEVRAEAVKALGQLDGKQALTSGIRCLEKDAAPAVRAACAEVLGQVGGPPAIGALATAKKDDPDAHVKFVAGESLRRLGF